MGKEGDLWDDSALINAFDHAISTYKKMHSSGKNKGGGNSTEETEGVIGEKSSNVEFASPDINTRDAEGKSNFPATDVHDSSETSYVSKLEENHHAGSQTHQPSLDSTNGQDIQSAYNGNTYGQGVDDYNQLVAQYYELEEKRMKILEQLNQYGGWNHQYAATASSSGVPYSSPQDYSMPAYQVSDPNAVCSCCPCFSQCALAPCTTVPSCSPDESCAGKPRNNYSVEMDHKVFFPCEDGKIHKMAMGAAERALSTIRTTIKGDLNVNEGSKDKIILRRNPFLYVILDLFCALVGLLEDSVHAYVMILLRKQMMGRCSKKVITESVDEEGQVAGNPCDQGARRERKANRKYEDYMK